MWVGAWPCVLNALLKKRVKIVNIKLKYNFLPFIFLICDFSHLIFIIDISSSFLKIIHDLVSYFLIETFYFSLLKHS